MKNNNTSPHAIHQWLIVSCLFSIGLLTGRIIVSGHITYIFLVWNLFLAFVPYYISTWLQKNEKVVQSRPRLFIVVVTWLLFMPNSFYILTDLFHLDDMNAGHVWFDMVLILSFAWNGILFGILSIRKMESLLKAAKGKWISSVIICFVMWLNAFGVYIGRVLRYNSWDIITNPFSLFNEVSHLILNPYVNRYAWAMTFCFGCFMIIVYYSIEKLNERPVNP